MKEIECTITLRNNRLKERRRLLDYTQREVAAAAGMSWTTYAALETMRKPPGVFKRGVWCWSEPAKAIAQFHCVAAEELFTDGILAVDKTQVVTTINAADVTGSLLSSGPESPHELVSSNEVRRDVRAALKTLTPREEKVLRMRFGIGEKTEYALEEVGEDFGLSRERIRQIERKALKKLQHLATVRGAAIGEHG